MLTERLHIVVRKEYFNAVTWLCSGDEQQRGMREVYQVLWLWSQLARDLCHVPASHLQRVPLPDLSPFTPWNPLRSHPTPVTRTGQVLCQSAAHQQNGLLHRLVTSNEGSWRKKILRSYSIEFNPQK